jgi:hypothetical protein
MKETTGPVGGPAADGAPTVPLTSWTPTAYDRLFDRLRSLGKRYREGPAQTMAHAHHMRTVRRR